MDRLEQLEQGTQDKRKRKRRGRVVSVWIKVHV